MTPRPAPGAERVVAVLNFLAAHPDESFTLSELARRLDLNKATCHALLTTLTQAALTAVRHRGYSVSLDADARVQLGQALAELADDSRSQPVRGMLERLLDELSRDDYFLIDVEPEATYKVNTMGAPVFGPDGRV